MNYIKEKTVCINYEKAEIKDIFINNNVEKVVEVVFEDGFTDYYSENDVLEYHKGCE